MDRLFYGKYEDGHHVGEAETKTLRQLHSEDVDKRIEADLERAVRQSLDTIHARQNFPLVSSSKMYPKMTSELDVTDSSFIEVELKTATCGNGLKNEVGEYNCFLNVIIQSLWHLRRFRDEFLKRSASDHYHIGDPCVTCALYSIFSALGMASKKSQNDAVAPTALRIALSNLYPDSNFFQAEDIATKLCESVAASLEGKKLASFTRVSSTVQSAMEEALLRILTPKRSIDILRDVHAAKEQLRTVGCVYIPFWCC